MPVMLASLLDTTWFYPCCGALTAWLYAVLWGRGRASWAKGLVLRASAAGAGAIGAYAIALWSPDAGPVVAGRALVTGCAVAWSVVSVVGLWRTNLLLGATLDPSRLAIFISVTLALTLVGVLLMQGGLTVPAVAAAAVPGAAGYVYRGLLIVRYHRLPRDQRLAAARALDAVIDGAEASRFGARS